MGGVAFAGGGVGALIAGRGPGVAAAEADAAGGGATIAAAALGAGGARDRLESSARAGVAELAAGVASIPAPPVELDATRATTATIAVSPTPPAPSLRRPRRQGISPVALTLDTSSPKVSGDLAAMGGPGMAQRTASSSLAKGRKDVDKLKVAVVSRSIVVRGIVTWFRWAGLPLRSFAPEQLAQAFAFLAISDAEAMDLCIAVEELCATMNGPVRSASWVAAYRAKLGG